MRIFPLHVVPIFLNHGTLTGQIGAQVISFDVYYQLPPVVGFSVIGCEGDTGVVGFSVTTEAEEDTVQGFSVSRRVSDYGVKGFIVEDVE